MNSDDISRALRADANTVSIDDLRRNRVPEHRGTERRTYRHAAAVLIAAVAVVIMVVIGGIALVNRGHESADPLGVFHDDQPRTVEGACGKGTSAESLADVPRVAGAVVVGKVVSIRKKTEVLAPKSGTTTGDDAPSTGARFLPRLLTVDVEQNVAGQEPSSDSLEIEDSGWVRSDPSSNDWYPMVPEGWARLEVGDTGLLAVQKQPDGTYSFLCSGPLLVRDDRIVDTGSTDAVNTAAYGRTLHEIIGQLR